MLCTYLCHIYWHFENRYNHHNPIARFELPARSQQLIRLNLARYHCRSVRFVTHLDLQLPADRFTNIIGLYGVLYRIDGQPHVLDARIYKARNAHRYHVEFTYRQADWGKPPAHYKHASLLFAFLASHKQNYKIECTAQFQYSAEMWKSRIVMPIELGETKTALFTHMVGTTFAKIINDHIDYELTVSRTQRNDILHVVHLETVGTINAQRLSRILSRAQALSLVLVARGDDPDEVSSPHR